MIEEAMRKIEQALSTHDRSLVLVSMKKIGSFEEPTYRIDMPAMANVRGLLGNATDALKKAHGAIARGEPRRSES
ncbi:MAG: hypothetical protein ACRENE_05500 [Polyangiaceae bacterium]